MKFYRCAIKGDVSSEECSNCFRGRKLRLAASRVLCQAEHLIEMPKGEPEHQISENDHVPTNVLDI